MMLELASDNSFVTLIPCGCGGDSECGCIDRMQYSDTIDLTTLLANLAIAGALEGAFQRGFELALFVWGAR